LPASLKYREFFTQAVTLDSLPSLITVFVKDRAGVPLVGASVTLYGGSSGESHQTVTDQTGKTTFQGVSNEYYYILVTSNGYKPTSVDFSPVGDESYVVALDKGVDSGASLSVDYTLIVAVVLIGIILVSFFLFRK